MKYLFILVTVSICLSFAKGYDGLDSVNVTNSDLLTLKPELKKTDYSIPDSIIERYPFGNQNNINRFFPGVVSYFQNFYIRGGENYETGFYIEGNKYNDLFTGDYSFYLNPNAFQRIDYYNGFIPTNIGNTSSGLFDYHLKTGGDKLEFNIDYLSDNITFTNDAFSGKKRLGAYYYGHNETNFNLGGPLLLNNLKFFVNANYLFQRDKNPQRYPGIDNLFINDRTSLDSITINLPTGIVPLNSFESFNLLSTILYELDELKIKAYGIYFNENELSERHHILDYLNSRTGLINKSGGIINLNLEQNISNVFSYSINGNYYNKSEVTTDPYLGSNYWDYGDSVANANAGVVWERSVKDVNGGLVGRYMIPSIRNILGFRFTNVDYPGVDHKKALQERWLLSGNLKINLNGHKIRIGGEYSHHKLKYWEIENQAFLAPRFAHFRLDPSFDDYSDDELKELLAIYQGVNNFGYGLTGGEAIESIYEAPEPLFYALYIDEQIILIDKININAGLRFDHFNFDYKKMIDPAAPEKTFDIYTNEIIESGLVDIDDYSFLSPRISIDYLVIPQLSLRLIYLEKVQNHPFSEIYQGYKSFRYNMVPPKINPVYTGEAKPIVTSEYGLSLNYTGLKTINMSLTYYNKNTINHISLEEQKTNPSSPYQSYYYFGTNSSTKIWGLEYQINYYNKGLTFISNISYQNADIEQIDEKSNKIIINAFTDYDFLHFQNVSGFFTDLNLGISFSFNSGHPYFVLEGRSRYPGPYSGTTPNIYQFDIKIEKGFSIFDNLSMDFYLYVINLFDAKNVYDIFPRTGSADNDGFLDDPEIVRQLVETFGEQYLTLYRLMNKYNPNNLQQTFYGPPRQIGFGVKLNY